MTYKVKATVTLEISIEGDAEVYVDISHDELDVYDSADPDILSSDTVFAELEVEFEVDAETEEEAEEKAEEMLTENWTTTVSIGGVEDLVSSFVDDVTINILQVTPLEEEQDES